MTSLYYGDKSISHDPHSSTRTKGVLRNMAAPTLSITKGLKNAVTSAAAQTIIAIILTVGFVSVQIFSGMGFFIEGQYGLIMGYFGPIEAIVVGFYFAVNIRKNGSTPAISTEDFAALASNFTNIVGVQSDILSRLAVIGNSHDAMTASLAKLANAQYALTQRLIALESKSDTQSKEASKKTSTERGVDSGDPDGLLHR